MLLNGVWFYLLWFSAVWGRESFIAVTALLLCLHLYIHKHQRVEWTLILVVALIGISIDQLLLLMGVFVFQESVLLPGWLCLLWAGFAATLRHSLRFAAHSLRLAALLGAVGGASSYFAGARLGAVSFGYGTTETLILLATIWSGLLPLFFRINRWLSRVIQ